ncbi:MAG: response regulator [Elusimicrobia bacterium]|nr:response regulator [Elusimicrobiota bacterium]
MSANGIKVLIIDDDSKHRESLGDVVDSFGYAVDSAGNFDDAKAKIQTAGPFQLVLLDYMFGPNQKTGLDALGELRTLLPVDQVPILLMTGYASLEVAVRALRQGLSDFLIKPIDPIYLKHTLEKNLEKSRLIQENQRLFKELQVKNDELARLSDLKSKFLSFCAHDLSNTVSSSTMASDLLLSEFSSVTAAPQVKRLLELLADSLSQTQRLIGDLVDWSSIEKGKFHIDQVKTTVAELMKAPVFIFLAEKAKNKGVSVKIDWQADKALEFTADAKRLIQVVTNLLENGLRYTPSGGTLGFRLERKPDGMLAFEVSDSGEGIDPEDLPHLFESFYQGKDPKKQRGRLGLGLSIAKEIIEGHGGTIEARSEGHGKGTSFSFKIPLA